MDFRAGAGLDQRADLWHRVLPRETNVRRAMSRMRQTDRDCTGCRGSRSNGLMERGCLRLLPGQLQLRRRRRFRSARFRRSQRGATSLERILIIGSFPPTTNRTHLNRVRLRSGLRVCWQIQRITVATRPPNTTGSIKNPSHIFNADYELLSETCSVAPARR